MICNTIGLTTDSFETLYVHGRADVPEVYGSINYAQPIFYSLKTLTGAASYSFMGYPEPLKSYEISGNMVQNGTPAPTSPIYPQECGDRTANLLEITNNMKNRTEWELSPEISGSGRFFIYYDITNVIPRGTISANIFENFSPGYTPNLLVCAITPQIMGRVDTNYRIMNNNGVITPRTFDTTSWDGVYLCIGHGNGFPAESVKQQKIDELFNNWKITITESSTPPSHYEPYGYKIPINLNGTTQNIYLTEPLRKIGNYADEVNSDGTVTRRIKEVILTGNESWRVSLERYYFSLAGYPPLSSYGLCTHFNSGSGSAYSNSFTLGTNAVFGVRDLFPTLQDFVQFLNSGYTSGAPITLYYPINPTTKQVTAPTLTPATGSNTLAIDTTLQPSSLSITGHVKPSS